MGLYLAQINIARAKFPMDDPRMADFVNNIQGINAIADASPGFIWRWIEEADSRVEEIFGDWALVVNMSVWESRDALVNFAYRTGHAETRGKSYGLLGYSRQANSTGGGKKKTGLPRSAGGKPVRIYPESGFFRSGGT